MIDKAEPPREERRPPRKVSGLLLLLGAGLVGTILALTGVTAMRTRSEILAGTERQLAQLDMVFAEQTGRTLETVDFLLKTAINTVQSSPGGADMNAVLARSLAGVRQVTALMIADAAAHVVYSSEPHPPTMLPAPGEQLLQEATGAPNTNLHISNPERDPNGTWCALDARDH
jgi:hypothetical protein